MLTTKLNEAQLVKIRKSVLSAVNIMHSDYEINIKSCLSGMYMDAFPDATFSEADVVAQNVIDSVALFYKNCNEIKKPEDNFRRQLDSMLKDVPQETKITVLHSVDCYLDELINPVAQNNHSNTSESADEIYNRIVKKVTETELTDEIIKNLCPSYAQDFFGEGLLLNMDERTFISLEVMSMYILSKNGEVPELKYANIDLLTAIMCSNYEFNALNYQAINGNIFEKQYNDQKRKTFIAAVIGLIAGAILIAAVAAIASQVCGIAVAGTAAATSAGIVISEDAIIIISILMALLSAYAYAFFEEYKYQLEQNNDENTVVINGRFDNFVNVHLPEESTEEIETVVTKELNTRITEEEEEKIHNSEKIRF